MSIVKSFSVGDGDMFYIDHNSDNFTTIDCCYSDDENKETNFEEMKEIADKKGITRSYLHIQTKIILKELRILWKSRNSKFLLCGK